VAYQNTYNPNFNQPQAQRLSFDSITETFGDHAERLDNALRAKLAAMDPNNTGDMLEFQVEYNKYLVVENLRASIIKAMKDVLQGIIQKF
jgi:type III secretion protein F